MPCRLQKPSKAEAAIFLKCGSEKPKLFTSLGRTIKS